MKKITEIEIHGNKLYFSDDVEKYFKIWWKYSLDKERVLSKVEGIIKTNNEKIHKVTKILQAVENHIRNSTDKLVKEYVLQEKYEYTVDNVLGDSEAYKVFWNLMNDYQKFVDDFHIISAELKFDLHNANVDAKSHVTGNGFGVWADSVGIASYLISDYYATKKQAFKAEVQLAKEQRLITEKYNDVRETREIEFLNHILESSYTLIYMFYNELFIRNIQLLIDVNDIDETNILDFNLKKSNDILTNISYAKNKIDVIIQAINAFPGNIEIYKKIAEYGLEFPELDNLMKFLSIDKLLITQMEEEIEFYISNHSIIDSFYYNKNKLEFIACVKHIDRSQYCKIVYKREYESVIKKFNSLADMIKNNEIQILSAISENAGKLGRDESVLKPIIFKYLIGDIDEITIFKNELGYSNIDKELCLLIGETDCDGINEVIDKYVDHFYKMIIKMLNEEDIKKVQEKQKKIEEENIVSEKQERKERKRKKVTIVSLLIVLSIVVFAGIYYTVIVPQSKYNEAVELTNNGKYEEAIKLYTELSNYKDSQQQIAETKYNEAVELTNNGQYEEAIKLYTELVDYKDSKDLINKYTYDMAIDNIGAGNWQVAKELLQKIDGYKDASTQLDRATKYAKIEGKWTMVKNRDGDTILHTAGDPYVWTEIKIVDNSIQIVIRENFLDSEMTGIYNEDGTITPIKFIGKYDDNDRTYSINSDILSIIDDGDWFRIYKKLDE